MTSHALTGGAAGHESGLSLEDRVARIEDQLAIYQVVSAYGLAADASAMDVIRMLWREDCIYENALGAFHGHAGLQAAYDSDFHRGLMAGGSAHASTQPFVVIAGDRAIATQHFTVYANRDGDVKMVRLAASRWSLVRTRGEGLGWRVVRRINHMLDGTAEARDLLARLLEGPGPDDFPQGG